MEQRRADAEGERVPGRVVGVGAADLRVASVIQLAEAGHQAGGRLDDDVVAGAIRPRPLATEGGVVRVDNVGLDGADGLVVEAELRGDVGTVVDHHHVGVFEQLVDHGPGTGVRQVDRE